MIETKKTFLVLTWQRCHELFLYRGKGTMWLSDPVLREATAAEAGGSSPAPCRNQSRNSTSCSALQLQILREWMQSHERKNKY